MGSQLWLTLAGLILCVSGVFSYPLAEDLSTNSTSKNETTKNAERDGTQTVVVEDASQVSPDAKTYCDKSTDHEHVVTFIHDRKNPFIGGCKEDENVKPEDKAKEPMGPCECEAYRSILEKAMLRVLPNMEASAVDPGIMLGCALNKDQQVQIRLAIRFKSKACTTNCHKTCNSDGSDCKVTKEKPMLDFPTKYADAIKTKTFAWKVTEIGKLDAGEFMNAIGGCNTCMQEPASCPAACGCPQTYTAQECPANTPPQCCNAQAPAAPAQGEVQMQQIVVAPAPQQPMSQASQAIPAPAPCQGSSCMMGIPVVQANICAPHCPSTCAPSCMPSCCNGGAGKRMLAGRR